MRLKRLKRFFFCKLGFFSLSFRSPLHLHALRIISRKDFPLVYFSLNQLATTKFRLLVSAYRLHLIRQMFVRRIFRRAKLNFRHPAKNSSLSSNKKFPPMKVKVPLVEIQVILRRQQDYFLVGRNFEQMFCFVR